MGFIIPIVNRDSTEVRQLIKERLQDEIIQKRMVLIIVAIALLLDNMLYMVIVPIVPDYLRDIHTYQELHFTQRYNIGNGSIYENRTGEIDYIYEDEMLGFLFASKAIIQLVVNPFSGTLIDRIGYEYPMIIGLLVLFVSTAVFAVGQSYGILFLARSIQGLGSAFADTSGLAMIADRFTHEHERSKALGIALAFISFGCLVAPPFGGFLMDISSKATPFVLLALLSLIDAILVFMVIKPKIRRTETGERLQGTPIHRLFCDPYIAVCAGSLIMANVSLAFLEPTIGVWMETTMPGISPTQIGIVWLPPFIPHVFGVYATVYLMRRYPQHPWALTAIGLVLEGISCLILPYCKSFGTVIIPLSILCFGIALIDTSILPLLGYLVDTRHVSVYGSVYAIADISYSLAYAFGPIVAGKVVANSSFEKLNIGICVSNLLYAPVLLLLRNVYRYRPAQGEMDEKGVNGGDYKSYGTYNPADAEGPNGMLTAIQNDNFAGGWENGGVGQQQPKQQVEWKDTLYERKVKKPKIYRGYKETDAILGDDEEDEEDGDYK